MTEENWDKVKELLSSSEDILITEKSTDKLQRHLKTVLQNLARFEQDGKFPLNEVRQWKATINSWLNRVSEISVSHQQKDIERRIQKSEITRQVKMKRRKRTEIEVSCLMFSVINCIILVIYLSYIDIGFPKQEKITARKI